MLKKTYHRIKYLFNKYERLLMPLAMAIGFVVDNFTLRRIDMWLENLVILFYFGLIIGAIIYINTYHKKAYTHKFLAWLRLAAPFVMQYAFGAMFSAFIVFYFRSSSLVVSWPFLLLLLGLLVANDFFRQQYQKLCFHLSILYLALFTYCVFLIPIIIKQIGSLVFISSGLLSLVLISLIIYLIYKIDRHLVYYNLTKITLSILGIFTLFNILYFSNIIPPIPLAMQSSAIYHSLSRVGSDYQVTYEQPAWYNFWRETNYNFHWQPGTRLYVFSAIFAPAKFNEQIIHRWSYFNESQGRWQISDNYKFSLSGGRELGFRGYSYKSTITPGKWRVDVLTNNNQVLGRIRFRVILAESDVELKSLTK